VENQPGIGQWTIGEILFEDKLAPNWPIVIARPLKLFPKALGLTPGVAAVPSREFLVRVLTDYPTHQALLRDLAGDHFKNFENHVRGKHDVSPTTLKGIAGRFGVPEDLITSMKHGNAVGPLLPQLLSLFGIVEALPNLFYAAVVKEGIPCEHCRGNLIDDHDSWWTKQELRLPKPAYDLIERLLGAVLVGTGLWTLIRKVARTKPIDQNKHLSDPSRHPFGHWLARVMQARGVRSYFDLCAERVAAGAPLAIDENRLSKWASGGELLPISVGLKLIDGLPDADALQMDLYAARTLAFAIDLVAAAAAAPGDVRSSRKDAQDMIHRRLGTILVHLRLFGRVLAKTAELKRQS
jgi:hypothetical protein